MRNRKSTITYAFALIGRSAAKMSNDFCIDIFHPVIKIAIDMVAQTNIVAKHLDNKLHLMAVRPVIMAATVLGAVYQPQIEASLYN